MGFAPYLCVRNGKETITVKKLISLFLCVAMICTVCLCLTSCKSSDYKEAVALLEAGNYEEAKAIFEALGDYEDSQQYLSRFHYFISDVQVESEEGIAKVAVEFNETNLPARVFWETEEESYTDEYFYDDIGNITRITQIDAEGNRDDYDYTYNEKGLMILETHSWDEYKNTYEHVYDENGNLIRTTGATKKEVVSTEDYTYDAEGKLIKRVIGFMATYLITTEYTYDANGNLIKEVSTDKEGVSSTTEYTYDDAGNQIKEVYTSADGSQSIYESEYDENGNLIKLTSKWEDEVDVFDYTLDAAGNVIAREHTGPEGVWEKIGVTYTLMYIPYDLPEDTLEEFELMVEL